MLRQASVEDIANQRITRLHGRIIVVTHYYPRFLKSKLIHEYLKELAPSKPLLTEYKDKEAELDDHDLAFDQVDYENKFCLTRKGLSELSRVATEAVSSNIYLICHCKIGQRCHREILMLACHVLHETPIGKLSFDWRRIRERLAHGDGALCCGPDES